MNLPAGVRFPDIAGNSGTWRVRQALALRLPPISGRNPTRPDGAAARHLEPDLEFMTQRIRRPTEIAAAACLLALALAGCNRQAPTSTQVAARVNGDEISTHQVQAMLQRQPRLGAQFGDNAPAHVLDTLVEQELAAQAARKDGLDSDPQVLQALEIARREVLARAYQDKLADAAVSPSSDEIDRYYDEHPKLFRQRQRYQLQEFKVQAAPEALQGLAAEVASAADPHAVEAALRARSLDFNTRQTSMLAEELPLQVLDRVGDLRPGASLLIPRPTGALVLTVLQAEPLPIERAAARDAIRSFLSNDRRRQLVAQGMKALRDKADVQIVGSFARGGGAPGPAASAAPQVAPAASD